MTRTHFALGAIILFEVLLLFIGCHGNKDNPLTPDSDLTTDTTLSDSSSTTDHTVSGANATPPALWGLYEISYDKHTHEIQTVPLRGPAFAFNVVNFLQPPMGSISNMTIGVLDDSTFFDDGRIDVRIILHHPFPGQPVYTGFDVCGIFLTEGTISSDYNSALTYADPENDPSLLNPDGITRWMNPSEFLSGGVIGYEPGIWGTSESSENSGFLAGATLNPYKYFAHGLGPDENLHDWLNNPGSMANRGMFPSGASCSRDYELKFPIIDEQHVFIFNYAVLANWTSPDIEPPGNPLEDFPPEANAGWPLHIWAVDNSNCYYTEEESGGNLSFDLEIFDWNALNNPEGMPGEISKFVLWSNEPLIENGWFEFLDTEVEWNSGFTASTSTVTIDLPAIPEQSGDIPVWIEIQSAYPSSYDQGFGAEIPKDPLASYICVPVNVKTCPKAGSGEISGGEAGSGEYLNDVIISGENFVDGPELGFWLENMGAGGEAGTGDAGAIYATDVHFIDENTVTADFNLADVLFGDYGLGCINGCGTITEPEENILLSPLLKMKVNIMMPFNIQLTTNREGPASEPLETVTVSWMPVPNATYYRIYARIFDVNGSLLASASIIGGANNTSHTINLNNLPNGPNGILELWITALPENTGGYYQYESIPSSHARIYMQDFEGGLGEWAVRAEDNANWRFIRSTVDCAYDGDWGLKSYNSGEGFEWILFASPQINDFLGANTVKFEFLHRFREINEENGYQVGWLYNLPYNGMYDVYGYYPISTVDYGLTYNDTDSPSLRHEFDCSVYNDNNWQYGGLTWQGWSLSGFDLSEILGDEESNYLVIGAAVGSDDNNPGICIDDVAILVY